MNRKINAVAAGVTATLVLGLAGCSSDPAKASGLFDEVKSAKAVSEKSHYVTKTKAKRVCVAKNKKGVCTSYVDRPDGTKRVKVVDRPAKAARYCVELDNVNGNKDRDDVLFEVGHSTYLKWSGANEGAKVTDMEYSREVTNCKN
jgi:hypothetical protein